MQDEIKLIVFDLNETLIDQNSWADLNAVMGITPEEDQHYYQMYYRGEIDYEQWLKSLQNLYIQRKNPTRQEIAAALSKYEIREDAKETIDYLKNKGYKIALISAGIDIIVDMVAKELGIEMAEGSDVFVFSEDGHLKEMKTLDSDDSRAKVVILRKFCDQLGISFEQCACVGDGASDIEIFLATGHGVTFRGMTIENKAWKVIDKLADLKSIF